MYHLYTHSWHDASEKYTHIREEEGRRERERRVEKGII